MVIKISKLFSPTPGGRYMDEGMYSAEEFRTKILEPAYRLCSINNEKLCIDLDGGYGYTTGFLEESFGGLVRLGYSANDMLDTITFVSHDEPQLIDDIRGYIIDEGLRKGMLLKRGGIVIC